jgi:hypothetical protein
MGVLFLFKASEDGCPQVTIRVSVEQKKLIKEFGWNYSDVWKLGFEKMMETLPGELAKKAEYHKEMLLQCNNKLARCSELRTAELEKYDELKQRYLKGNRSIDHPNQGDLFWINEQCKKYGLSSEKFKTFLKGGSV